MIRQDVEAGPNFAGQYTLAMWGCGSTCVEFAIVDAQSGKVYFHPTVRRAWQVPYQAEGVLQFRRDSRLLIIAGQTEGPGGEGGAGKFYYEWKDNRFTLIREDEIRLGEEAPPLPPRRAQAEAATGVELDALCAGIRDSYECAQAIERHQLQQPPNAHRVKRDAEGLHLKLRTGRWLTLKDHQDPEDETSVTKYSFRDYRPEIGYFVLHRQFYQHSDHVMISERMELDALCGIAWRGSHECAQIIERHQLQQPEIVQVAKRDAEGLRLKLRTGRWLTVKDHQDPDDVTSVTLHSFRDYFPEIGYFLLHRAFYEGSDYLLIHDRTGSRYELHDVPAISPDRQRLVAASDGVTGGYSPNLIQIWRLTDDGMELKQEVSPEGWGPSDPAWIDDRTIRLIKNYPFEGSMPRKGTVRLKRNGEWRLLEDAAPQAEKRKSGEEK